MPADEAPWRIPSVPNRAAAGGRRVARAVPARTDLPVAGRASRPRLTPLAAERPPRPTMSDAHASPPPYIPPTPHMRTEMQAVEADGQLKTVLPANIGETVSVLTPSGQTIQVAVPAGAGGSEITFPCTFGMLHDHSREAKAVFPRLEFDVTNNIESLCGCLCSCGISGWLKKTLVLDTEEAELHLVNNCVNSVQKRPYAQLASVDKTNSCCVCWGVSSDLGEISPGFGCDRGLVSNLERMLQEVSKSSLRTRH